MIRTQTSKTFLLLTLVLFCASVLLASDAPAVKRGPLVIPMIKHDVSPALRDIPPAPRRFSMKRVIPNRLIPRNPLDPSALAAPDDEDDFRPGMQSWFGATAIPATIKNFEGIGEGLPSYFDCCAPPDTNGEVGPTDYVQIVNLDMAVFSKTTGAVTFGPVANNTLWAGFGGDCEFDNDGDPTVNYDQIANRWVIAQFALEGPNFLECVAVSTTASPTGTYNRYSFNFGPIDFPDYPKLAVWPDAYYATYNIFGNTFTGRVCAMDRTRMLAGLSATQQCFDDDGDGGLLASDLDGATLPPVNSPNFAMQINYNNFNSTTGETSGLKLWKFHIDFVTPANSTFSGPTFVAGDTFGIACITKFRLACIKQPKPGSKLEALSDRLMHRLAYRNFGDHESLVVNHAARLGNGAGSSKTGIHWYEVRSPNATPTVFQQQTYAPDKKTARWMGSIAQDKQGNMALGFSATNKKTHLFPSIFYTGRLVGDPLGQMTQGEGTIINGTGAQNGGLARWGDYSDMTVDPADDCTFWYTQEYESATGAFNWHTRIASFKYPGCI